MDKEETMTEIMIETITDKEEEEEEVNKENKENKENQDNNNLTHQHQFMLEI